MLCRHRVIRPGATIHVLLDRKTGDWQAEQLGITGIDASIARVFQRRIRRQITVDVTLIKVESRASGIRLSVAQPLLASRKALTPTTVIVDVLVADSVPNCTKVDS